ncbi:MAG: UDP-2,4-diacetamido-2,4,6-trideoxy-beta-L-altropyranose hydrolase [candidate division KSB1 bacterium]|nr:UDP-2,4-diacetamido-2,4,6-trideoxy-beta-L-altropyranose hydrolase [candidate division KSB1 bacterium]MDZ7274901.1 UDP-2,4-diacetamido-2,4,6-trideoxy-beta-L-altropyranose hydrolase [candidate division KSB1 bacterium]MDZ7286647.1 UDP-2,4-diacetamido-2,4,6-trideoxy-beta-L-altropyranose hydrolase [candidate division KSB1 bacterium]MDZ7299190.1 UDP-2,4-diacetamido-2,4,6-trideoxy-beta-L-altropyranose hydrolase [candidate division KSB1 bacterium]MDZ7308502.1 UDP-2,4-diacetamido-2,4,6-trideoxy-beta-
MSKAIIFRTDGSHTLGVGHVYRCLALAEALHRRGCQACFAVTVTPAAIQALIRQHGHQVEVLAGGAPELTQLAALSERLGTRLICVDSYAADAAYFRALQAAGWRTVCIDDFAGFPIAAGMVINHNAYAAELRYDVPAGARLRLGPRYALLRRQFRETRLAALPPATPPYVLVLIGGSDPQQWSLRLARSLLAALPAAVHLVVVAGPATTSLPELQHWSRAHPRLRVLHRPPDLPAVMAGASLAISGAGVTTYELACLGVPSLLLIVADNQRQNAAALGRLGIAQVLGWHEDLQAEEIAARAAVLLENGSERQELAARGRRLVDGAGAERVAGEIVHEIDSSY